MRTRHLLLTAVLPLSLIACGDDDTTPASPTTPASAAPAPAATTPAATTPPVTSPAATAPAATNAAASSSPAGATAVGIELDEFTLVASGPVAAGEVTFSVKNVGERAHEFAVFKGTDYAALPHQSNGAVDEAALGAANIVGRTAKLAGGQAETITLNLPAGQYVFICNLGAGPNSHAAKGQHLAVTVG